MAKKKKISFELEMAKKKGYVYDSILYTQELLKRIPEGHYLIDVYTRELEELKAEYEKLKNY